MWPLAGTAVVTGSVQKCKKFRKETRKNRSKKETKKSERIYIIYYELKSKFYMCVFVCAK